MWSTLCYKFFKTLILLLIYILYFTILGAWLSEETQALREDVYEIMPFMFELASETFQAQKAKKLAGLPGRGSSQECKYTPESALNSLQKDGKFCFVK